MKHIERTKNSREMECICCGNIFLSAGGAPKYCYDCRWESFKKRKKMAEDYAGRKNATV